MPIALKRIVSGDSTLILSCIWSSSGIFVTMTKLTASDGSTESGFGNALSLSNDYAAVGASGDSTSQGVVYMFLRSGSDWSQQEKITASDGDVNDRFGCSVSIYTDYVASGAYQDSDTANFQGAVYIYNLVGVSWVGEAKLTAADGAANDFFGWSVSLYSDKLLIGAYGDDVGVYSGQGSAYVFLRSGSVWSQQTQLTASDGAANDEFGYSVSMTSDYAISGAYNDDGANVDQGSAYVYLRSGTTWSQQAQLIADDGAADDNFGSSVFVTADYALVGAPAADVDGKSNQGAAYMYSQSGSEWTLQLKLIAADGAASDHFGYSSSIDGDYAVIGAYLDDVSGNSDQGSAYVFLSSGSTWSQQAKLIASDGAASDLFGLSVSIYGDYAISGAEGDDVNENTNQGSAYLYYRSDATWSFACESGTYISGSDCVPCPAGSYNSLIGQTSCISCSAGTCNPSSGSTSASDCEDCAAGKYNAATGVAICVECPTGTYNPDTGSTSFSDCISCPSGTYEPDSGSTSEADCTDCGAGKYNPNSGSSVEADCIECAAGTYSDDPSAAACLECSAGKYSSVTGSTEQSSCQDCEVGKYSSDSGSADCTNCAAGTYESSVGATSCDDCGSSKYSNSASSACSSCGSGEEVNADQSGCNTLSFIESDPAGAVTLICIGSFLFGVIASFGWYKYRNPVRYDKKRAPLLDQEMARDEIISH